MTTIGGSAVTPAWAGDSAVLGAVIVAMVPIVLHAVGSTVSDYVAIPGAYPLLGVSTLAAAGLVVAAGVAAAVSRLPTMRPPGRPAGFGLGPALLAIGLTQRLLSAPVMVLLARAARTPSDRRAAGRVGAGWGEPA